MTDSTMDDNIGVDFHNVDVNCDGSTGHLITGLNQKVLYRNIDYSCIIGSCDGCIEDGGVGDGIVNSFCASLNNFYPDLNAATFYYYAPAYTEIHTALPKQNYENMQGLDEPKAFELAYTLDINTNYTGFITVQSTEPYHFDYDCYKFTMPFSGNVSITVNNMVLSDLTVCVFDSLYNSAGFAVQNFGSPNLDLSMVLKPGNYYLRLSAIANTTSYLYPYDFSIEATPATITGVAEGSTSDIVVFPNPVKDQLTIESKGFNDLYKVEILNVTGEKVYNSVTSSNKTIINTSAFSRGIYIIKVYTGKMQIVNKFIKE